MDYNFFKKIAVSEYSFADLDNFDVFIPFTTQGIIFSNDGYGVVEYSFDGSTIHGELNSEGNSSFLTFNNRVVSTIWFKIQSGSTAPIQISIHAWGIP